MLVNFVYIKRDTPIHRLDPRVKWILLFSYAFSVMQTVNFWFTLFGFLGAAFYYSQAKLKWSETKRPWLFILFLTFMLVVVNYFTSGGAIVQGIDLSHQHILYQLPFIAFKARPPYIVPASTIFSVESITFIITQAMRNISIALLALPITYTTDPGFTGVAFKGMGVPDKFSYAIDLSIRFLPTIVRDFGTTLDAQRARGFEIDKLRGGFFSKVAKLAPLLVPVVIGSIVGAEDIISSMELRCFGVGKRTWLTQLHPRQSDRIIITLSILGFATVTTINILGNFYTHGSLHFLHMQGIPQFLVP
ncbi:MAG: energy-coupling factor transporter transmembrane component T family protein [Ktedonobacteraceae bacterium]